MFNDAILSFNSSASSLVTLDYFASIDALT